MSSLPPESSFPQCSDGDVTIIVSTRHQFRLHSRTLRTAEWFRKEFDTIMAPKLTAQARRNGATPYRFVLVDKHTAANNGDDQDEYNGPKQEFFSVQVSESGSSISLTPRASVDDLSGEDEDRYWEWLFGCFYKIPPKIDESNFGATVRDCMKLLEVADMIKADVRNEVDLTLMRQDETLWKAIANAPTEWAEVGYRIRSPKIFKEAVIHLVGKWKMLTNSERQGLTTIISQLCQKKWDELELAKRAIEIRISGHYPSSIIHNHEDRPQRTIYSNDIYMWMALAFFRQYISQSGSDKQNRLASDGGYKWYKQLHNGGSAYLDRDSMRDFHSYFPMSSKAVGVLEAHMNFLKAEVKVFVKDLMVSKTHLNPASFTDQEAWLTCTVIEDQELPWKGNREEVDVNVEVNPVDEEYE